MGQDWYEQTLECKDYIVTLFLKKKKKIYARFHCSQVWSVLFFLSLFQVWIVECFVFYVRENLPNGSVYVKFLVESGAVAPSHPWLRPCAKNNSALFIIAMEISLICIFWLGYLYTGIVRKNHYDCLEVYKKSRSREGEQSRYSLI